MLTGITPWINDPSDQRLLRVCAEYHSDAAFSRAAPAPYGLPRTQFLTVYIELPEPPSDSAPHRVLLPFSAFSRLCVRGRVHRLICAHLHNKPQGRRFSNQRGPVHSRGGRAGVPPHQRVEVGARAKPRCGSAMPAVAGHWVQAEAMRRVQHAVVSRTPGAFDRLGRAGGRDASGSASEQMAEEQHAGQPALEHRQR